MLDTKGVKYKFPIRVEDLEERLSHLEKDFKGLVKELYRRKIIKEENERDNGMD